MSGHRLVAVSGRSGTIMPRAFRSRVRENATRRIADRRFVSRDNAMMDVPDDDERKLLEPVARYFAILREWSLKRQSNDAGAASPSDQL
jgi:hypothetical protein